MGETHLLLNDKIIKETREEAIKRWKEDSGEEDYMQYNGCDLNEQEVSFDDGVLEIYGDLMDSSNKELGTLTVKHRLDLDIVINIIEYYRKKLAKLKTVLEATKDTSEE